MRLPTGHELRSVRRSDITTSTNALSAHAERRLWTWQTHVNTSVRGGRCRLWTATGSPQIVSSPDTATGQWTWASQICQSLHTPTGLSGKRATDARTDALRIALMSLGVPSFNPSEDCSFVVLSAGNLSSGSLRAVDFIPPLTGRSLSDFAKSNLRAAKPP